MFASFNVAWIQLEFVGAFATFLPLGLLCAYLASATAIVVVGRLRWARARPRCARQLAPARGPARSSSVAVLALCLAVPRSGRPGPTARARLQAQRPTVADGRGRAAGSRRPSRCRRSSSPDRSGVSRCRSIPTRAVGQLAYVPEDVRRAAASADRGDSEPSGRMGRAGRRGVRARSRSSRSRCGVAGRRSRRVLLVGTLLVCAGTVLGRRPVPPVPGFSFLTQLGRMLGFWCFAVALLGGLGLDRALQLMGRVERSVRIRFTWRGPIGLAAVAVAAFSIVFTAYQTMSYARSVNPPFQPRASADLYPATPVDPCDRDATRPARPASEPQRILPLRGSRTRRCTPRTRWCSASRAPRATRASRCSARRLLARRRRREAGRRASRRPLSTAFIANYFPDTVRLRPASARGCHDPVRPAEPGDGHGLASATRHVRSRLNGVRRGRMVAC